MPDPVSGWVGFFDILGYRSFLENNEPAGAAERVLEVLANSRESTIGLMTKQFPGIQRNQALLEKIHWLVISDSVLVTYPRPTKDDEVPGGWLVFLLACVMLQRDMFEFGLPMRGAITVGSYIFRENCFAGRPIVEAYSLAQTLDLAATVFSPEAGEQVLRDAKDVAQILTVQYLTPKKSNPEGERKLTLNYYFRRPLPLDDITQHVLQSFWGHRKDISSDAARKARHTEQYLRYLVWHEQNQ